MTDEWYIADGGETRGPFTLTDIFDQIDRNEVGEEAWFTLDGVRINLDTLKEHWPDPRIVLEEVEQAELARKHSERRPPPPAERDSILILGRRRAGKTIYLATLYQQLWKSTGPLTMKALAGPTHKVLAGIAGQLQNGQWPEATLGTRRLEFELDDHGHKRLVVAFDYSGEDFRRAFVDEETESPEVKKLLDYLNRAAAVILLIDPAVAHSGKHDEVVDDDFGMVQAVEKIRNWHGGDEVPIAVALTKGDRNREVIMSAGTKREFIFRHYPALVRTLGNLTVFTISAVQEERDAEGNPRPSRESVPINIDKPLLYCLDSIRRRESMKVAAQERAAAEEARVEQIRQIERAQSAFNWKVALLVAGICVIGLCICVLIWILRTD